MEDRQSENCEKLFEYLRSILYDTEIRTLDPGELDEPYRKLGKGLQQLQRQVEELRRYTRELSQGNLSAENPSRDNFLCASLKNLHANLNHLTWQAAQVAEGDYSQHVSYLGEFSNAFNTMIRQLQERETMLREEAVRTRKRAKVLEEYNDLLMEMIRRRNEWIFVVDAESRQLLYCNKQDEETDFSLQKCENCRARIHFLKDILEWQEGKKEKVWTSGNQEEGFFRITTFHIEWQGHNAFAHIVEDVTSEKLEELRLTNKAYQDPGTGIYNRLFFEEYAADLLEHKISFVLCYLDLDELKYVNDHFGHGEGDAYIRDFVGTIQSSFRNIDVFARIGGDEFCLILTGVDHQTAEQRLEQIWCRYSGRAEKNYRTSFSFGVVQVCHGDGLITLDDILNRADAAMYQCKRKHRNLQT